MYYWLIFVGLEVLRNRWIIGFQVASFYLIFDIVLNGLTGDRWNYQGKSSGYLDKLPMWAYLGLKALCLVYLIWFIVH